MHYMIVLLKIPFYVIFDYNIFNIASCYEGFITVINEGSGKSDCQ